MITFDINPDSVVIKQDGQETRVQRRTTIGAKNWIEFWERAQEMTKDVILCAECGDTVDYHE